MSIILIKPILTEKMAILQERENKYAFIIHSSSNKIMVKKAVEKKFNVKVKKVGIINQLGKEKTMNVKSGGKTIRTTGHRSSLKKAIVTLSEDSKIDFIGSDIQDK